MTARVVVFHRAPFGGQERMFKLRLGEVAELEQLCGAGIGALALRIGTHQFYQADIRETVRLGLQGGGLPEPMATALVMNAFGDRPLSDHIEIAARTIEAYLNGIPEGLKKKDENGQDEQIPPSPETSQPGTASAE